LKERKERSRERQEEIKKEWTHETTPMNKKWMGRNREINVRS
jgi:hypothetical protein